MIGNIRPELRSKISRIQLLLLVNYTSVAEFGIDRMLQPIVEDLRKLESVSYSECHVHLNMCNTHITLSYSRMKVYRLLWMVNDSTFMVS